MCGIPTQIQQATSFVLSLLGLASLQVRWVLQLRLVVALLAHWNAAVKANPPIGAHTLAAAAAVRGARETEGECHVIAIHTVTSIVQCLVLSSCHCWRTRRCPRQRWHTERQQSGDLGQRCWGRTTRCRSASVPTGMVSVASATRSCGGGRAHAHTHAESGQEQTVGGGLAIL